MRRVTRKASQILICALLPLVAACGPAIKSATAPQPFPPEAVAAIEGSQPITQAPIVDPVIALIAESDHYFRQGQTELEAGHVEGARDAFDRALSVLLESPNGGRSEPRLREHFDRLVERISTYEIRALADGDGFTEQQYEPASIDDLLALSATLVTPEVEGGEPVEEAGLDFPVPLNARVQSFVKLFEGRLHGFLADGLARGSQYLPMIRKVFRQEGLPLDLAYVPLIESAFKPQALSRARAKGIWQFMRGTGIENGLRQDWYVDERSDPEKATVAAAKYLNTLVTMFDGDWLLALASYNGGPGRVQSAIRRGGGQADFWRISSRSNLLPRETRDYVPMILAAIIVARNPEEHGFGDIEGLDPLDYETVELNKPVDLRRIAEWTDVTVADIQALNPELRRWTTPVRDELYSLKVPDGTAEVVGQRLIEAQDQELASLRWYTVKKGDTLQTIARNLRTNRTDLADANFLKTNARVTVGQRLIVPHEPTVLLAAATNNGAPSTIPGASGDRVRVVYEVRRGDTLAAIARSFRTTVSAIQDWNSLNGTRIFVGDQLTIYTLPRGN